MLWRMVFQPLGSVNPIKELEKNIGSHAETNQLHTKDYVKSNWRRKRLDV
jgi:hypothetical protein